MGSLKQGENRLSYELQPDEVGLCGREVAENPSFDELLGPVRVDAGVVRTGQQLMVAGSVSFRARLVCALCGVAHERAFNEPLNAVLADCDRAESSGLNTGEPDQVRFHGDVLDLAPLVRDAVHLAVPMAPTCRPDCRGLCSCCGANLNLAGHDSSCSVRPR
ncbi:DUF177 domain-containing protein [candidate division WOR-3 bacterium]|nr:DUF177 domain-containing protein [candidate division WOR-3 bacterium]